MTVRFPESVFCFFCGGIKVWWSMTVSGWGLRLAKSCTMHNGMLAATQGMMNLFFILVSEPNCNSLLSSWLGLGAGWKSLRSRERSCVALIWSVLLATLTVILNGNLHLWLNVSTVTVRGEKTRFKPRFTENAQAWFSRYWFNQGPGQQFSW